MTSRKYAIRCANGYVRDASRGAPIFTTAVNLSKGFNTTAEAWTWLRQTGWELVHPQVVIKPINYQRQSAVCLHTRGFNTGVFRTCPLCHKKRSAVHPKS